MTDDVMTNGGLWLFAILALMWGGNGFGFGNNGYANGFANAIGYENLATSNEVQRGFDNQNSMANQREILSAVNAGVSNLAQVTADKYNEITRDLGSIGTALQGAIANQIACCGDTKLLVQGTSAATNANINELRYNNALSTEAINANTTAQTQKILDALKQNEINALRGRVNQLELQNTMAGVVKYPNSIAYNAGISPFCANTCGCNAYA